MVAGEVCRGFFQELVFHLQFPVFPLGLAQSRPLAYGERRFFAGMVTAVGGDPVTEGAFVYSELLGYPGDRTAMSRSPFSLLRPCIPARSSSSVVTKFYPFQIVHPNGWTVRKVRGTSNLPAVASRPAGEHCIPRELIAAYPLCGSSNQAMIPG